MSDHITRLNAALEGRYRIERQLGEGGMATVYLADDLRHERKVALKVLKPELAAVVGAERFLTEIKTTANLQHPHILPLFDSGEADSFLFYVMPYVVGESLRERFDREHQLPVDEAVAIASKIAGALRAAHDQGVIHRDIKPANILLSKGEPLISDFGIALAVSAGGAGRLTETGLSLGTPHYMSPEQATGDVSVGAATDIYAVGCVLYEMLVGSPPFVGGTPQAVLGKIVTGEARSAMAERKSVPPNVDGAIRKALEKVPADRFASAGDMASALRDSSFRHRALGGLTQVEGARGWKVATAAFGAAAILFASLWSSARNGTEVPQPLTTYVVDFPDGEEMSGAFEGEMAMSPDGERLVYRGPDPLPDGNGLIFWIEGRGQVGVIDFRTGERRALVEGTSPRYAPSGHLMYVSSRGELMAAPFDLDRMDVTAPAIPLRTGLTTDRGSFVISQSGRLAYLTNTTRTGRQLVWVDRDGTETPVGASAVGPVFGMVRVSPDGTRLATSYGGQVWLINLDGSEPDQLTFQGVGNAGPEWTSDGRFLSYVSSDDNLFRRRADRGVGGELLWDHERPIIQGFVTDEWYVITLGDSLGPDVYAVSRADESSFPLAASEGGDERAPAPSPDARLVAYVSDASGTDEVYVRSLFDPDGRTWTVSQGAEPSPFGRKAAPSSSTSTRRINSSLYRSRPSPALTSLGHLSPCSLSLRTSTLRA